MNPLITVSSSRVYRRCAREYLYRYEQTLRPVFDSAAPLRYGKLIHSALEAWLPAHDLVPAAEAIRMSECDDFDRAKAEAMILGYHTRWADDYLDVVAVEQEFACELRNPLSGAASRTWTLAGKIDAIVKTQDGRTWVMEHKTSSEDVSAGSLYWQKLRLDSQISTYFVGARSLGYDVTGCLYDVLRKPQIRPLLATPPEARKYTKTGALYAAQREQDETPDEYRGRMIDTIAADPEKHYQRGEVVRLETEERDAAHDLWVTARLIRDSQLTQRWPRNPDACTRYGRLCDYWPICVGEASADDASRFRVGDVHEELSQQEKAA
jgi:hypothetical protein